MRQAISLMAGALLYVALQGCAVLQSRSVGSVPQDSTSSGSPSVARAGMVYMMPKALLPVELVINGAAVRLNVLAPTFVGDPTYRYVLEQPTQPFRSDNVVVEIDPRTSLLKSVKVTSVDNTGDIIKKIAATLAKPESAEGGDVTIYRALIDPADPAQVAVENAAMNEALAFHLDRLAEQCPEDIRQAAQKDTAASTKTAETAERERCRGIATLRSNHERLQSDQQKPTILGNKHVWISVEEPSGLVKAAKGDVAPPSCLDGICHRPTMPFTISAHVLGAKSSTVAYLPNDAPILSLPIASHALVTTTYDVVFTDGSLAKVTRDVPSSALALVSLPLDVAKAVIGTVNEFIQLKIDTSGKEKALADARIAEISAQAALEKLLADRAAQSGQESGYVPGVSSKGVLLTAAVGKASSALPFGINPVPLPAPTPGSSNDGTLSVAPPVSTPTK
jgi:hypothetical protein